jgi:glycosyltransferase involved in cell wall biosynthesis
MRIAAISYYYHPVINGVVLTIDDWKRAAQASGSSYIVLSAHHRAEKREPGVFRFPSFSLLSKFGISVPWFPGSFVAKTLARERTQIIHVHHPFMLGTLALIAGRRMGIPVVFTYHTRYSEYVKSYLPFLPHALIDRIVDPILVAFMNQCAAVTVALPTLKQELIDRGVRTKITVVPIGIDTKRFGAGDGTSVRKLLGVKKDDILLISVSRIAKEKNIFFLLEVASHIVRAMPNVHFCWIGTGPEEPELLRRMKAGMLKRIHILGVRSYKDVPNYYAAGDAFLSASLTETFGRVFTEAMAAGLPVFAAKTPTIVDVVEHKKSGIILDTSSASAFAQGVMDVLNNPVQARALGDAARVRAQQYFDLSVSWNKLEALYKKTLLASASKVR